MAGTECRVCVTMPFSANASAWLAPRARDCMLCGAGVHRESGS
jgi:hypothetical protein